jgi:hypothetical protein
MSSRLSTGDEGWCINRAWQDQKLQAWPTALARPNFAASSTRSIGGWSATVALITGDRSAAEDAVHDAMLKAWQLLEGDWVVLRSAADAPVAVRCSSGIPPSRFRANRRPAGHTGLTTVDSDCRMGS